MEIYQRSASNGCIDILSDFEKLSTGDKTGQIDELHLAAQLGKTLLERNGNLEEQLKKLEQYAEDTLITNQTLSNQLASCKDALRLANSSCESLEGKLEELEAENSTLKVVSLKNKETIQIKTKLILELQQKVDALHDELTAIKSTKGDVEMTDSSDQSVHNDSFIRQPSQQSLVFNHEELMKEHNELVEDLNIKLQNMTYQKSKLQQLLEKTTAENIKLSETLEKIESDNIELQVRIKSLEEELFGESEPITPSSITSPSSSFGTYNNIIEGKRKGKDIGEKEEREEKVGEKERREEGISSNGLNLFGELQRDYSLLKDKYDELVADGDSSKVYRKQSILSSNTNKDGTSLRDLFQEVYATLKQTTIVADRLIDRHKFTSNKLSS